MAVTNRRCVSISGRLSKLHFCKLKLVFGTSSMQPTDFIRMNVARFRFQREVASMFVLRHDVSYLASVTPTWPIQGSKARPVILSRRSLTDSYI